MEKQKLAEMVLAKMKQKKDLEDRNRPHFQVLRLEALFEKQLFQTLKNEIQTLESQLTALKKTQLDLQKNLDEVDNTGKKPFPRIIILPEFIASQNIQADVKQFYRKTSNSFLKTQILRVKGYEMSKDIQKLFLQNMAIVRQLQAKIQSNLSEDRKITNAKRVKVLKQDLRLRSIRQQQKQLKQIIQQQQQQKKDLLRQYEIKKVNLNNRKDRLKFIEQEIARYKLKIEESFNPLSYREHLKKVFDVEIKNQFLQKNLKNASKKVDCATRCIKEFEKKLQKTSSLVVLGRTNDSPSVKLGLIQKRLSKQRENQSLTKRNLQQLFNKNVGNKRFERSLSSFQTSQRKQNSIPKMDLQMMTLSQKKNTSAKTTDRSHSGRNFSSFSRHLF